MYRLLQDFLEAGKGEKVR